MFGETEPAAPAAAADPIAEVARMQDRLDSTYVGTVTWSSKANFANVIGSTDDPKVPGFTSWISLWQDKCNGGAGPSKCTSYNYFSNDPTRKCSSTFYGGHVVTGKSAMTMPKGSTVYIFPVCGFHNASDTTYMEALYNLTGVQLSYW
jgi:hypothetical protein